MGQDIKLCIDPRETITKFNYEFCKAVFKNAKQLELNGELYTENGNGKLILTRMGAACFNHLERQVVDVDRGYTEESHLSEDEVANIFSTTRKFLEFFKIKE